MDAEAGGVAGVIFGGLETVVEVFFLLNRAVGRVREDVDAAQPFAASVFGVQLSLVSEACVGKGIYTPCSNVAKYNGPQRRTMDFGQRLSIHFPSQKDFMGLYFSPRHRNKIVEDLALLEVGVHSDEFDVFATFFQTTTILQHLFETDAGPNCGPNRSLSPLDENQ